MESWTQENCVYEDVTLCLLSCQDSMCLHSCSHAVFCFGFVCCCCPPPSRVKPRWSVPSSHRCLYPIKHILKVTEGCAGLLEYSGRTLFIIYAGRSILELSIYLEWSPSTNGPTCNPHPQFHVSSCRTAVPEEAGWEMGAHPAAGALSAES